MEKDQILDLIHSKTATFKEVRFRGNRIHCNGLFMKILNNGEKIATDYFYCMKCDNLVKRTSSVTNHCKKFHQGYKCLPEKKDIETCELQNNTSEKIVKSKLEYPNSIETKVEYPNCIQFFEIKNYYQMSDKTHP